MPQAMDACQAKKAGTAYWQVNTGWLFSSLFITYVDSWAQTGTQLGEEEDPEEP